MYLCVAWSLLRPLATMLRVALASNMRRGMSAQLRSETKDPCTRFGCIQMLQKPLKSLLQKQRPEQSEGRGLLKQMHLQKNSLKMVCSTTPPTPRNRAGGTGVDG